MFHGASELQIHRSFANKRTKRFVNKCEWKTGRSMSLLQSINRKWDTWKYKSFYTQSYSNTLFIAFARSIYPQCWMNSREIVSGEKKYFSKKAQSLETVRKVSYGGSVRLICPPSSYVPNSFALPWFFTFPATLSTPCLPPLLSLLSPLKANGLVERIRSAFSALSYLPQSSQSSYLIPSNKLHFYASTFLYLLTYSQL